VDERRAGWLLIVILVGQLVLLGLQVPGAGGKGTYLGVLGLRLIGPFARGITGASRTLGDSAENLRLQGRLVAENRRLRREVEDLRLHLLQFEDVRSEADRLAAALRYAPPPIGELRAADVVYLDFSSWLTTLVIYSGGPPVQLDQVVLAPTGLVGRVVEVASPYAKVQLLTDRSASVGAMIVRTRRQGVLRGAGSGTLDLEYIPVQADVRSGDRLLTAGIDGIFPRGIPIGTVVSVKDAGQLFHEIRVVPAVDLGTLDRVYLLDWKPVPKGLEEATDDRR
jgi:rod shape-determining protein MreC